MYKAHQAICACSGVVRMQEVSESHSFFTDLAREAQVWVQATSVLSASCFCDHTSVYDLQSCSKYV